MKEVKVTVESKHDMGVTVRTSHFPNIKFTVDTTYYLEFEELPYAIPCHLSRKGTTLYSGRLRDLVRGDLAESAILPEYKRPVFAKARLGRTMVTAA